MEAFGTSSFNTGHSLKERFCSQYPAWFWWFSMGPLRLLIGQLIVALGSNHCWLKGWSLVFSSEEYGGLGGCYGPFGSPMVENNVGLL